MRRHLDRRIAVLLDQTARAGGKIARRRPAGALIYAHLVTAFAADQHVDGQSRGLAGDVPKRMLDSADRGVDHRAARKAREVVHGGPEVLDIARILADQPALEIADGGDGGLVRPDRIRLAPARDA